MTLADIEMIQLSEFLNNLPAAFSQKFASKSYDEPLATAAQQRILA